MAARFDRDRYPPPPERDWDRYPEERAPRFDDRDDYYSRPPPQRRYREHSDERYDRGDFRRPVDDDVVIRERERRYFDDEPRFVPRPGPPPADREFDRRILIDREREREYRSPSPAPLRRPNVMLRRQSSLDTFDRRPPLHFLDRERREEYPPPARREDVYRDREREREREEFRAPPYVPIPLPRSKQLPPAAPQRYEDIQVAEPGYYGDEEFRTMPERIREREVYRSSHRRRDRSRDSRTTRTYSHRSSSRSSSISSRTSSTSGGTTIRSEYPKKGKTRIPARLVAKRALIELGYPYTEEGNTVIVLKALGQENIDELLKLSEDYKKGDMELAAARSAAANLEKERREEVFTIPPPPPPAPVAQVMPPPPPPVAMAAPPPPPPPPMAAQAPVAPVIVDAGPPPRAPGVEFVNKTTVIRDPSPTRSTSTYSDPFMYEEREYSNHVDVGPLALASRSRSQSRSDRDIRKEIKALEAELRDTRLTKHRGSRDRELVRAERLPDGALVLHEERVEKVEEGHRGIRIEKDKKGRMAISVPKYYR